MQLAHTPRQLGCIHVTIYCALGPCYGDQQSLHSAVLSFHFICCMFGCVFYIFIFSRFSLHSILFHFLLCFFFPTSLVHSPEHSFWSAWVCGEGGGKHNTKCDLQLEQTLAKIWFCLAMYVDFVCYVAKWQRDGDWFDHIYIGACIFKSQSNDMNYVSLLLSMFPFLWHGTMHTFIEHFF